MEKIHEKKEVKKADITKHKPYSKYTTDSKKTDHFTIQAEKYVNQINRALYHLELISNGRTYVYTTEQVNDIQEYILKRVTDTTFLLQKQLLVDKERFKLST